MSAVSIETFDSYTGNYEEDDAGLKQIYIDSAESLVMDHIGYDFNTADYTEILEGNGFDTIGLCAFPINEVTEVTIDGVNIDLDSIVSNREIITYLDDVFTKDVRVIVKHNSGNVETPGIIKLVILQIAALLFTEQGGNIGITSKSSLDNNTRTFVKTTNFEPYLSKLNSLRIVRL